LSKNKGESHRNFSPSIQYPPPIDETTIHLLANRYEGKLLLRNEIAIDEKSFQHLLTLRYFTSIPSIEKRMIATTCMRCNNIEPSLFGTIPCAKCERSHLYCRKCIEMGRIMECEQLYYWSGKQFDWPKINNPCTWKGYLTNAQKNATRKIENAIKKNEELLVWAVTGAGKTEMLFPGIELALSMGKRICIATPRADVVRELLPRLQNAFSSVHIQGLYSGSRDNDGTAQLIIATTHQLLRYRHAFDVLVVDEVDAFPYHYDQSLQFAANRAKKLSSSLIYLTATPRKKLQKRMKSKKLKTVFVPLRFHGYPLPIPKPIYSSKLNKNLRETILPETLRRWLAQRNSPSRQLLLFVPTVDLAEQLIHSVTSLLLHFNLIKSGSEVEYVHAEDKKREEKISRFRSRQLYALITTTILERGVTFPSIDVVVLNAGHEVFDEAALIQIAGRAGRSPLDPKGEVIFLHEGKTDAIVEAIRLIKDMNKRGKLLLSEKEVRN